MTTPIKVGIAGLGRAGWGMHCEELKGKEDYFRIVAACDPIASRLNRFKETYAGHVYEHFGDLLADPVVELVDIATRSHEHFDHALQALKSGKHVLLEKPISRTYEEAKELKRAAELSAGRLFIRHNRRLDPDFLHVREIIESGLLGEVFEIKLARHGFQRRDDWQTIKEFGGGQLLNWGPHIIDHGLRLLGDDSYTIWSDLKRVAAAGDSEDHVKIILKGTNGRIVDIEISGGVAYGSPLYTVYGTNGSLVASDREIKLKYYDPAAVETRVSNPGTPGETFGNAEQLPWTERTIPVQPRESRNIWDELYRSIRQGSPFPITLEEAAEVMKVISAAKKGTVF